MENRNSNFLNFLPDLDNNQENLLTLQQGFPGFEIMTQRLWAVGSIWHKSSCGNLSDAFGKSFPFQKFSAENTENWGSKSMLSLSMCTQYLLSKSVVYTLRSLLSVLFY